jgi:hypothetical protein
MKVIGEICIRPITHRSDMKTEWTNSPGDDINNKNDKIDVKGLGFEDTT